MLWNQIRSVAALTLGIGLVAGASGLAVVGAQDPTPAPSTTAPSAGQGPAPGEAPPPAIVVPATRPAAVGEPEAPPAPSRRGVVRLAFLLPSGGGKIPGPPFEPDLSQALRVEPMQITRLRVVGPEIVHHPVVYLPGGGGVGLNRRDIVELRAHLTTGGGTLLADAADSDAARNAAFRRFVAELLPENHLEPIPATDPLFFPERGFNLARARTTPALGGRIGPAELEGVRVDGHWAVVYSKLDLGAFDPYPGDPDRRGFSRESGIEIAANTILNALAPGIPARADAPARGPEEAAAKPQLREQRFATRKARIAADLARLVRELADLSVQEYEAVIYPRDLSRIEGSIRTAEAEVGRAEEMAGKTDVAVNFRLANQLTLERARFDLEQAQTERDVLVKYHHDKHLKALRAEVTKAEADQSAKVAAWEQERAMEARLEGQLDPK